MHFYLKESCLKSATGNFAGIDSVDAAFSSIDLGSDLGARMLCRANQLLETLFSPLSPSLS